MAIQLFDLGPPRVDTFTPIANLGKSFFDAYDAQVKRGQETEAADLREQEVRSRLGGMGQSATTSPAMPGNKSADVGSSSLPTFARPDTQQALSALKTIESSGRYTIVGPTHPRYGRALGAYQIMEANLPQWSREALGREVTPQEFLSNPQLQDQIAAYKFQQYTDKYGNPQDAASMWLTGKPLAQAGGRRDVFGTDAPEYVRRFNNALARNGGQPAPVQVASLSPGIGYAPDTPLPMPPAMQTAALGGGLPTGPENGAGLSQPTGGLPTFAVPGLIPSMPNGIGTPAQAPAQPALPPQPTPAPIRTAQAAPASPVASDALPQSFQRLSPTEQNLLIRMARNPLTAAYAMQRLEALRKQDEWSYQTAPNGQFVRTSKSGRMEVVPGFDKPQDRYETYTDDRGNIRQRNVVNGQETVLDKAEGWQQFKGEDGTTYAWNPRNPQQAPVPISKSNGFRDLVSPEERAAAGVDPGFKGPVQRAPDGKLFYPNKASTEVNISNVAEKEEEKLTAADTVKRQSKIIDAGEAADRLMVDLRQLREISSLVGAPGASADVLLKLGPYAQALNIDIAGLSDLQAYNAIVKRLAPQQRVEGSGSTSDIEYKGMLDSLGSPSLDPRAREAIFDTIEATGRYDQQRRDLILDYREKKISREELNQRMRALGDPMANFRKFKSENPGLFPSSAAAGRPPAGASAAKVLSDAKEALRKAPGKRKEIEEQMRKWGVDPKRLDE